VPPSPLPAESGADIPNRGEYLTVVAE
jgi:hypothetical protein